MTVLLSARGLGKRYPDATLRRRAIAQWSLRDVDLDVHEGEVLAVVGRNGAGKSTLLKLAAGVTLPTAGTLRRTRQVAPLIEVGAGFHPDLTGFENVGLNGRLLGMSRRQIAERMESIVDFAELAAVIDAPVKTYSSGMFMRLGFAVAVHTEPRLLLVDEVLAVGDLPFQIKCIDRIRKLGDQGVGILFVSHNLAAVQSLATRAILLASGRTAAEGDTRTVIAAYHENLALEGRGQELGDESAVEAEAGAVRLLEARVTDRAGQRQVLWTAGDVVVVHMTLEARADVGPSLLGATLHKRGAGLIGSYLGFESPRVGSFSAGERRVVSFSIAVPVTAGGYTLDAGIASEDGRIIHFEQEVAQLAVGARPGSSGLVDLDVVLLES